MPMRPMTIIMPLTFLQPKVRAMAASVAFRRRSISVCRLFNAVSMPSKPVSLLCLTHSYDNICSKCKCACFQLADGHGWSMLSACQFPPQPLQCSHYSCPRQWAASANRPIFARALQLHSVSASSSDLSLLETSAGFPLGSCRILLAHLHSWWIPSEEPPVVMRSPWVQIRAQFGSLE